jgi:hypothetical protein
MSADDVPLPSLAEAPIHRDECALKLVRPDGYACALGLADRLGDSVCLRLIQETTLPLVHLYPENGLVVTARLRTRLRRTGGQYAGEALIVSPLMLPSRRAIVDPYVG